ncbi:nucleoprotein TPR-like [Melitaea cinxia]|uniref:nucleoprotein TPR-like n=1 Tax=Melitaea cinxia TaxID=113334 RepID=UPI001E272C1C|nr:nucleoprotein TPR-like [Melitaea cinxia]
MESTDNVEVIGDKKDGDEMASLRLLEKKDYAESIEEVEGSSDLNIVNEDGTADDTGSCEIVSKHMEETLLDSVAQEGKEIDKQSDSDNQDEEMELRWDDDDLDEEEVKNENELLGEGSSDTSKYPLTLEEKVMKSIEEEEKLLEAEINDTKESPPDLTLDNVFVPKIDHNLNKPDMMLEIPTHELIEFSDDEDDLTSNLEMSPDIETDEETKANDIPIEEIQVDVHKKEIDTETSKEIAESALEKEARLAADILTKQLNAMDDDISLITDDLTEINKEINEDELLQDALQEELLECPIDKTEEPFKIINKLIDNTLNTAEESQEDNIQGIEDHITNSCEEMLLKIGENEAEDLENTELKSELPVDVPNKITDTKSTDDSMSKVISIESNIALKHTSNILESKVDKSTLPESVSSDSIDAKILDKTSIETEKEEMLLNESNVDSVIKESLTDVQRLKYNEPDTLKKELEVKNISNENAIDTIEKTLQLSEEIKKLQNDPKVDQPVRESLKKPDSNLQKSDIVADDPLPISTADREKTPELTMSSDESLNETMVELPPQTINEPKPSTSTAGEAKLTMSSDESLNESMVELPAQTIDETKPSTSTASKTKLTMSSDESPNQTTVELPAETINEPKPSTSTACEIKLTMSSDELLNETTVELPAQTIDEPKPSTSTACETELTMSSGESPNETTVELPAETINEPKPSTSTAFEIKLTMSSDELLNETTVELPAQTIDEPKPSTSTACETKLTMSSYVSLEKTTVELPAQTIDEPKPLTSTSSQTKVPIGEESLTETMLESAQTIDEPKPSTSAFETKGSEASMFGSMMVQETSKDVPEMTDSLGLLAESSRVMEEDEEQEYDDEGEDEDDFDQDQDDESSNQMTAEHSEDSNAQHSETDQLKEDTVDKEFTFTITDVATEVNEVESMECDVTDTDADNIAVEKTQETNEIDEVVPADSTKDDKDAVQMDIETVKLSDTSDNEVDMETGGKTILEKLLLRDKPPTETTEKQSPSKRMKLEIVRQNHVMNFVDLEESSSEDGK